MEPLEPRLLLSADFMPAAADAMGDGFDLLDARLTDFLDSESNFDQRIPFLLQPNGDEENPGYEAPAVADLFSIPVDANGDGYIGVFLGSEDENILDNWDDNDDGVVNTAELLDALLFTPLQQELAAIEPGDDTDSFVDALVNDINLEGNGFDVTLDELGGDYNLEFDLISASNLTQDPDAEVVFDLQFSLTLTRNEVPIDLGLKADDLRLLAFTGDSLAPQPVNIAVDSTLNFGFEFGVYTGGQNDVYGPNDADLNADDFFIRRTDDMVFSITADDNDVDFNLNIGFLGADVVNGNIDMQDDINVSLVDPDTPEVLGFETSQYGVEHGSGTVTAANEAPAVDLPHDAGFVLRIGNIGIATDVLVADDNNNSDNNDLVADIQGAVDAVGLAGLIDVDLTGSDRLQFSLVPTDAGALGFDTESLAESGVLTATDSPVSNQPGTNVSFLLSLGGAIPRLVTVRAPGSERDDIGFGSNQSAKLNALTAQAAANPSGTLEESGDTTANFELRVTESDGTVTTASITVAENLAGDDPNDDVGDLVVDLNDALSTAGVGSLVTAGQSGGVISLTGTPGVSAIEVLSADGVTENDIGLAAGQASFLTLTAANPVGEPSFNDGLDNTFDDARFTVTVNGVDHVIDVAADNGRTTAGQLATAIDTALDNAGLLLSAQAVSGSIVLTADDNSVESFEITTGNQDLADLLYDLNNALDAAGINNVAASEDTGNIRLTAAGGETLEITRTLTFDAGVRGAELDGAGDPPDASFESEIDNDASHLTFTLPVEVKEGLREAGTSNDYDPQDMAIVGNFNPFDSTLSTFVASQDGEDVNRFFLDYSVNPPAGDDPLEPIPNPVPDETLQLVNFAEALQFNRIGPGSFIGMLGELGAALDSIMQTEHFADYGIPFTDATLKDLVRFEDMIKNSLIYDTGPDHVFNDSNPADDNNRLLERRELPESGGFEQFPVFTTAQEMGRSLSEILSLPVFTEPGYEEAGGINPTYDPGTNELTYDINIISSRRVSVGVDDPETSGDGEASYESFTPNFLFNIDLSPFGEFTLDPLGVNGVEAEDLVVTVEARSAFSGTIGFDLTPQTDPDLDQLEERFFVRDGTLRGAFTADLPDDGVAGTALLGLVGVNVNMDGTIGAQFSAQLQDEGGPAGSQVSLETIQEDITNTHNGNQPALEVVTDPTVTRLSTFDYDGQNSLSNGFRFSNISPGTRIYASSGGSAYVLDVTDEGSTGSLLLFGAQGNFDDDAEFVDVRDVADYIDDDPSFAGGVIDGGLTTRDYFGELVMHVAVQDGFKEDGDPAPGFGTDLANALDGLSGDIDLNLVAFGDPNNSISPAVDGAELNADLDAIGNLADFVVLSYTDLVDALQGLRDLVGDLETAYPVLSQVLPVVNRSVSDLLGLTEGVDRAVASARALLEDQAALLNVDDNEVPTLTLQGMAAALRGAFGLPDDSQGLVIDIETVAGTPYLTLDFDIEETVSTSLGMDIDLGEGLPNLTSPKVLRADGSLGWGFKIGVNLDDPSDVQLFNPEGGLDGDLSIVGEGAEGVGLVFLAQVGEMPVQVMDALVDIQLDFDLGGLDFGLTNGIKSLADVEFGDFVPNIDTQSYDISIPLFDINGGLTGFLGEITAAGDSIIDDANALLSNGLLDSNALDDLTSLVDDFVAGLEEFDPLDNLLLLTDTADLFFETIQDLLDGATSIGIPIVGDNLADGARFIEGFRDQFINKFRHLIETTNDISVEDVTGFIEGFFTDIGLDNIFVTAQELTNDINNPLDDEVRWMLSLGNTYSVPFDLGFDLGVPLLGMELDIPLDIDLAWSLDIGFGVNQDDGAFIILNDDAAKELNVDLTVDLPPPEDNQLFRGELGFLELIVKNNGSGLNFDFDIDLSNTAGGTTLPVSDLGNLGFDAMIGGEPIYEHLLDLDLEVGVIGADTVFPRLVTDFIMDWSLDSQPEALVDNVIEAGLELIDFQDVRLDLTSFLDGFLNDVLGGLTDFLSPLIGDPNDGELSLVELLYEPIPILNDVAELIGLAPPDITLISLAQLLAPDDVDLSFLEWLEPVVDLLQDLASLPDGELLLPIGELEIFGAGDPFGDALFNTDLNIEQAIDQLPGLADFNDLIAQAGNLDFSDINDALTGEGAPAGNETSLDVVKQLDIGDPAALFSFPFLEDPGKILGLLVGENVSLIEVDIPPLGVGFDWEQFFTIFGPLGANIGAGFFVGFDFSFGFDTYGLSRFADSGFTNPGLIFDGFFFGDRADVTTGTDIEEVFFEFTVNASAEINLGIASGGVGGGITTRIGWDLYDPDNDGAVHLSEILNTLSTSDNPLVIFDLQGEILAKLFWYLVIDFGITKFETGGDIFPETQIISFEYNFDRPPILATEVDNGDGTDTLVLNMGPNAVDRLNGDTSDGNEVFEIDYQGGDIRVKSPALGVNNWQTYSGNFTHVIGLGGQGNDSMTFTDFDETNITFDLQGDVGDDVIQFVEDLGVIPATGVGAVIRGGSGNDRLIGSHLDDEIYGEQGDDIIEGGRGYDVLFGDSGRYQQENVSGNDRSISARVSNLDGNDTVSGGDQDDIIIGGGGIDDLSGDAGSDVILGDAGRFGFDLTGGSGDYDGHLDVSAFDIPAFVPNDRLDDDPAVSTAEKIQDILLALTNIFTGTDLGDGADDTIHGGADGDIIFGGAANDQIDGGGGADHVVGGRGFDTIYGDGGNDVLFGNEQDDVISGGSGSDVIAGGFGDDVLHGDSGNDYMTGSRGRDIMYGDAGDDEVVGQGEPDILFGGTGDDLVIGGVGADIMFGDDGIVVKFGETEADPPALVIGNGNAALADPFKSGADGIIGSLDLILTDAVAGDGNDILSGGEGGDIILGGGGNDLGGGDVDPRSSVADTPAISTPDGRDILIGDGGVVEFNQRRLQRVASVVDNDPVSFRDTLYGDNGNDVIIGGQGADGDDNGSDPTLNIPSLGIPFLLAGGHGPGRGATDDDVSDEDVIIGDNGELVYVGEGDENFGRLAYIQTTDTMNSTGGADTAYGEEGDDIILGGVNGSIDVLNGSTGEDVILGDNGLIHFYYDWQNDGNIQDYTLEDYTPNDGDVNSIDLIRSFFDGLGGVDIVSGEQDSDVLIGGEAGDFIYGDNEAADSGSGDLADVMLGDNGDIFLAGDSGQRLVQGTAIDLITTSDVAEGTGGADVMSGNAGADIVIGGVNDGGIDHLYGDARDPVPELDGDDILLGDNGLLDYTWDAIPDSDRQTLDLIATTARAGGNVLGGVDHIFGNAGSDTAFGGSGADRVFGDNEESVDESGVADTYGTGANVDILFGDQGIVELANNLPTVIRSTDVDASEGGADHIQGGDFDDIIIGGVAGDELHGEAYLTPGKGVADLVTIAGRDIILGDEGRLFFNIGDDELLVSVNDNYDAMGDGDPQTLDLVETFATDSLGGNDDIYGNDNDDIAMGGFGDDLIYGDFYLGSLTRALNPGADTLLGDGGQMYFREGNAVLLRTSETDQGGSDIIQGNDEDDVIMGGMFDDLLYGETDAANLELAAGRAGEDIILGDNGRLDWTLPDDTILGRRDVIDAFGGTGITVDDSYDPATLDRITTIAPTHGGNDVIYGNGNSSASAGDVILGGTGNDNIYGDTDEASPNGVDGPDGSDLLFGDHGKLYPILPSMESFFINNYFFSIDTQESDGADFDGELANPHNDFEDVIWGNAASDILIGGQDDDVLLGGTGDDDLIGGHNVAGGHDELDNMPGADQLAISPVGLADLNPSDVNEINDVMDGGEDDDVMTGDNAIVIRQLDDLSPRFRMTADGQLYVLESDVVDNLANVDVGFSANVTGDPQPHQEMDLVRTVTLLDHSEAIETAAADNPTQPRVFGNDVMAGAAQDDEMFGQLGDDIIQGDGSITLTAAKNEGAFDPYNPAQGADPSFDVRNFTRRVNLTAGNDTDWTLRFDVFEDLDDGDDYIEGNGGNDRIYGNLGQDDIIGGSSSLFGLGDADAVFHGVTSGNDLRPDGADLIYGGAGNPALLSRNAGFGGADNDVSGDTIVPADEHHATDADTILGDNGDIFRIVVDTDPETEGDQIGYAAFNYDRDATTADGFDDFGFGSDDLTIRVRAVNLHDYGYSYVGGGNGRETLEFLSTARGEGDLIYGESGDDLIHGMTGDDVIFGNSGHDDLLGEIGNDFLLGGSGIDGIVGDDGLILTSRNSDQYGEGLYGIQALLPEQTNLKKNESPDPHSLNAEIRSPGNIQRAVINVENELTKSVELLAFRTDDLDGNTVGEFDAPIRFNDIIFGGLDNDFIHAGDGDDAVSGAEALPAYYSGAGFEVGPNQELTAVNTFLQNMQSSPSNDPSPLTDNPFWFDFAPYNPGNILRYEGKPILEGNGQNARTREEFAWYDEFNPRRKLMFDFEDGLAANIPGLDDVTALASLNDLGNGHHAIDFILNFDETDGPDDTRFSDAPKPTDGDDRIFGDLGNDWQVGGSGRDHMYGGRGNDLLNMDDDHDSGFTGRVGPHDPDPDPLDNKDADEYQAYADIAYAGAGRDVMILNTGADRAIDWVGEFNSYIVPFSPFGAFQISRTLQPQVPEFLYALSDSDGIDVRVDNTLPYTNTVDGQLYVDQKNADVRTDAPDPLRNNEPYGELGMVRQTDFDWQEQTGAPNDPQPGNLQGKREIMRRELFNDPGAAVPLAADVGSLSLTSSGTLQAQPDTLGGEVVGLYPLDTLQPTYTEILVTINADKDKAGSKSNGYVLFDYQAAEDFKFAGVDVGLDKLQIGHRDASGWVVDVQIPMQLKADTDYDLTVVMFGSQATVYVNENQNVAYDFGEPLNDGGMVGLGTNNATARFDDLQIQTLPPEWTFSTEAGFDTTNDNPFISRAGNWYVSEGRLLGSSSDQGPAVATESMNIAAFSRLELLGTLNSDNQGGFVFDYYSNNEFKYVALDVQNDEVIIGHYLNGQWSIDAVAAYDLDPGVDYSLMVTLFGSTATVTLDGKSVVTHSFNSLLNDGQFGVLNVDGNSSFDDFLVRGDDPAYAGATLTVEGSAAAVPVEYSLDDAQIDTVSGTAIDLLAATYTTVDEMELEQLTIDVADLPGDYLAVYQDDHIILDYNAAGYGWYTGVDSDVDGIDLLSVLLHEYGHALGLEHDSGLAFMAEELGVGERFDVSGNDNTVMVYDEDSGEFLVQGDEGMQDDMLVWDGASTISDDETPALIQWGRAAGFSGRTLQLR